MHVCTRDHYENLNSYKCGADVVNGHLFLIVQYDTPGMLFFFLKDPPPPEIYPLPLPDALPFSLEPLVKLVRLHEQLLRAALCGQRGSRADHEGRRPHEPPHPAPRLRSVTRPSDIVAPGSITTVVSNVS